MGSNAQCSSYVLGLISSASSPLPVALGLRFNFTSEGLPEQVVGGIRCLEPQKLCLETFSQNYILNSCSLTPYNVNREEFRTQMHILVSELDLLVALYMFRLEQLPPHCCVHLI